MGELAQEAEQQYKALLELLEVCQAEPPKARGASLMRRALTKIRSSQALAGQ